MKRIASILLLMVSAGFAIAQTPKQNLQKYGYYRHRIKNYFMVIGTGQGMSLPAMGRSREGSTLHWVENPIDNLGKYLGVLATEYKLLKDNGQPADSTLRELYYALEAFNRIDIIGDQHFGGLQVDPNDPFTSINNLNGFFIRDDVPTTFITDHPELQLNIPAENTVYDPENLIIAGVVNSTYNFDHLDNDYPEAYSGLDPSLDEILGLFTGLALVTRCVPNNTTFGQNQFVDGESGISEEAKAITRRIMQWLVSHNWRLVRPTNERVTRHNFYDYDFKYMSYAFNKMTATILMTDESSTGFSNDVKFYSKRAWQRFQNVFPIGCSDSLMTEINEIAGTSFTCDNLFDQHDIEMNTKLVMINAIIGDSWFAYNKLGVNENLSTTFQKANDMCQPFDWKPYYLLLYNFLHHKPVFEVHGIMQSTENHLNTAPCSGPNNTAVSGWASGFRYHRTITQTMPHNSREQYPGLDYMLVHNLHYLTFGQNMPQYQNLMYQEIHQDFPLQQNNQSIGSITTPYTHVGFETIKAYNTILSEQGIPDATGDVTFKASKKITLNDGFKVERGALFSAKIGLISCTGTNDGSYKSNSSNGLYGFNILSDELNHFDKFEEEINKSQTDKLINISATEKIISIFPNPNNGSFTVKGENIESIKVTDLTGRVLYEQSQIQALPTTIQLPNNAEGLFLVNVRQNGDYKVMRMIVR